MSILTKLEIYEQDKLIKKITYKKNFSYNNKSNKFDLKQYERSIEKNLISKISESIIINLLSI